LLSGWKNGKFVSVAFSNAVLLTQLTDTYVVDDNGGAIQGSWSPSHGSVHHPSHVWTFTVGSSETAVKRVVFALEDIVVLFHEQKPVEKQMLAASISTPSPMSLVLDANQPTKDQSKLLLARTVNANKALLQATLVTVEELLAEEPDAKCTNGGQSIVVLMNFFFFARAAVELRPAYERSCGSRVGRQGERPSLKADCSRRRPRKLLQRPW